MVLFELVIFLFVITSIKAEKIYNSITLAYLVSSYHQYFQILHNKKAPSIKIEGAFNYLI